MSKSNPQLSVTTDPEPELIRAPNPFSVEELRLDPARDLVGGKKVLTIVPVRKPGRQDYIMVRPEPEYRADTALLDLEEEGDCFLVTRDMQIDHMDELLPVTLYTAITRAGLTFLWPVRLPDPTGRRNLWTESARNAVKLAMEGWVRVKSNRSAGFYEIEPPGRPLPPPEWPSLSFQELLSIAFRGDIVRNSDHPAWRRLKGFS